MFRRQKKDSGSEDGAKSSYRSSFLGKGAKYSFVHDKQNQQHPTMEGSLYHSRSSRDYSAMTSKTTESTVSKHQTENPGSSQDHKELADVKNSPMHAQNEGISQAVNVDTASAEIEQEFNDLLLVAESQKEDIGNIDSDKMEVDDEVADERAVSPRSRSSKQSLCSQSSLGGISDEQESGFGSILGDENTTTTEQTEVLTSLLVAINFLFL